MKKASFKALCAVVIILSAAPGCTRAAASNGAPGASGMSGMSAESREEAFKNTAMYVPFGKDSYIMADQDTGMIFTVTMPDEIYDTQGKKITARELQKGNILEIYGNGVMQESYPGQYPGVEKIKVVAQGTPSDADRYQSIVDEIYQEPDLSVPPDLSIEYRTPEAVSSVMITRGGYEWSHDGQSVAACGSHVLQWTEMNDLTLPDATDLTLRFYPETPREITVVRWPAARRDQTASEIPQGESVQAELTENGFMISSAQPGYVYLVTANWERGNAEYGFLTK